MVSDSLPVLQSLGSQLQSGTGEAAQGAGESADSVGIEYIQCDFSQFVDAYIVCFLMWSLQNKFIAS